MNCALEKLSKVWADEDDVPASASISGGGRRHARRWRERIDCNEEKLKELNKLLCF